MSIPRLHHRAAGDLEYLPGHVAGDIRREEDGDIGDVRRGGLFRVFQVDIGHSDRVTSFLSKQQGHLFPKAYLAIGPGDRRYLVFQS